ncbi:MAG: VIT and VWA domain-containing protein [Phycisphaerales bacterium]
MSHDVNNPPPRDALDALLREWHAVNAVRAAGGRDRLLDALRDDERQDLGHAGAARHGSSAPRPRRASGSVPLSAPRSAPGPGPLYSFRRFVMHRYTRAAACLLLLAGLFALFIPINAPAMADEGIVQVPDGGRLEAVDEHGNVLGPCPLKHTDVNATISGSFSRVVVKQTYTNPYPQKIEAVYTFPLSSRAAVDRMTMTVGERVVVGEVKERERARQIYEQARESGYVASLLEQERPNIFTQSVANIEPGATVQVEIAYVEMLQSRDGEFSFDFPMVVGPRYIPGYRQPQFNGQPDALPGELPPGFAPRRGLVLLGPAAISVTGPGDAKDASPTAAMVDAMLRGAKPIAAPGQAWWESARNEKIVRTTQFTATYVDGAKELGELYSDRTGQINGRWFFVPSRIRDGKPGGGDGGTGFSPDTNLVPDASRITPMPVRPPNRAGHDISLTVTIDTGGAPITQITSDLHEVVRDPQLNSQSNGQLNDPLKEPVGGGANVGGRRVSLALKDQKEIPNRDFILRWRTGGTGVQEGVFTHVDERDGGFVTVVLNPPPRVDDTMVRPRELVFVLDTSGSMSGFPIEKAKAVMAKAIDAMRPGDTFNVITFAGNTAILWPEPRPATPENRAVAQQFLASRQGGGGTEMMKAIDAALRPTAGPGAVLDPMGLANLPADGRGVTVVVPMSQIGQQNGPGGSRLVVKASETVSIPLAMSMDLPTVLQPEGVKLRLAGEWRTTNGERTLHVREAGFVDRGAAAPMRIVMFLTDGYVGNDQAIVEAVRQNAGTTRVFAFGIGNSVNRYLLEQMSLAGRGAVDFVTLADQADKAVERFATRIQNPVLTDIALGTAGFELTDFVAGSPSTAPGVLLPDLYDNAPIMFHARVKTPGKGQLIVSGRTGAGPWERRIDVDVSSAAGPVLAGRASSGNPALPVLWARSKVESTLAPYLAEVEQGTLDPKVRKEVVALGERFGIATPYTSFVAVEKSRMTLGGKPMLVAVPVELPQGTRFDGFFGDALPQRMPPGVWRDTMLGMAPEAIQLAFRGGDFDNAPAFDLHVAIEAGKAVEAAGGNERPKAPAEAALGEGRRSEGAASGEKRKDAERDVRYAWQASKGAPPPAPAMAPAPGAAPALHSYVNDLGGGAPARAPAPGAAPAPSSAAPLPTAGDPVELKANLSRIPIVESKFGVAKEAEKRDAPAHGNGTYRAATDAGEAAPAARGGLGIRGSPGGSGGGLSGGFSGPPARKPAGVPVAPPGSAASTPMPAPATVSPPTLPLAPPAPPIGAATSATTSSAQPSTNIRRMQDFHLEAAGAPVDALRELARSGGGGGGGFGGSGGGGGSIFGSPGQDSPRPWKNGEGDSLLWFSQPAPSDEQKQDRAEQLRDVVTEVVRAQEWTNYGGTLADAVVENGSINYVPATPGADAQALVLEARRVQDVLLKALVAQAVAATPSTPPVATTGGDASAVHDPAAQPPDSRSGAPMAAAAATRPHGPLAPVTVQPAATPMDKSLVLYDVADLVAPREGVPSPNASERFEALAEFVQEFVSPDAWADNGGDDASLRGIGALFVIRAPARIHERVSAVLTALRTVVAPGAAPAARVQVPGQSPAPAAGGQANGPDAAQVEGAMLVVDVSALARADIGAAERLLSIVELVEPDSWMRNGGDEGHAVVLNGVMVVQHASADVLKRVGVLLDQLQAALGAPLPPERKTDVDKAQSLAPTTFFSANGGPSTALVVHDVGELAAKVVASVEADASLKQSPSAPIAMSYALASLVEQRVEPHSWAGAGGARFAEIVPVATLLLVQQTPMMQLAVDDALQAMREGVGLLPKPMMLAPEAMALRDSLAAEPTARAAKVERINTLFGRLDLPLFARAVEFEDPQRTLVDRAKIEAALDGKPAVPGDRAVAVNVLVAESAPATIDALRHAGLSIESRDDRMNLVIGWVQPERIGAVALTNGVRRIECVQ